jgi:putative transposase
MGPYHHKLQVAAFMIAIFIPSRKPLPAMPQSLSQVIIHLVFSTKHRQPWLKAPFKQPLHAYIASTVRELERCECYRVGGVEDHVHLAIRLSRTITIADLVQKVKTSSSRWVKEQDRTLEHFAWQNGYAAFSVYYREMHRLLAYIDGQEEHHRKRTFQDEYRGLMTENGIEFDERYVWD